MASLGGATVGATVVLSVAHLGAPPFFSLCLRCLSLFFSDCPIHFSKSGISKPPGRGISHPAFSMALPKPCRPEMVSMKRTSIPFRNPSVLESSAQDQTKRQRYNVSNGVMLSAAEISPISGLRGVFFSNLIQLPIRLPWLYGCGLSLCSTTNAAGRSCPGLPVGHLAPLRPLT